jgi:hypothetical protein
VSPERLEWRARQCFRYAQVATTAELLKFLLELGHELEREAQRQGQTPRVVLRLPLSEA